MNVIFSQMTALRKTLSARLQRVSGDQGFSFKRVLVAVLVGISLWSVSAPAQAASANDYYENERGSLQNTERYDKIQSETGDFNNFEDVDPRRNTQGAEAKAQALKDTAERQQRMDAEPLGSAREAIEKVKSKLNETASDVADSVRDTADDVTTNARRY
ncbi:MAG: hypothetical protein WBB01_22630 [Phormidesmis sp.]